MMRPYLDCFRWGMASFVPNENGAQVRSHDLVPLCNRNILRPTGYVDAGVIHEDIQPAEVLDGALNQSFDLRFIGDIGLDEYRPSSEFFDLFSGRRGDILFVIFPPKRRLLLVSDGDTGALTGKFERDSPSDARTPAGHNADSIFE